MSNDKPVKGRRKPSQSAFPGVPSGEIILSPQSSSYRALIRVRLSEADAHYSGGLVAGAKMLELFGDVATELLIHADGDEGLFAGYEEISFLAPAFAGDYIEATGRIVKFGRTSRRMEFQAHKVITSRGGDGLAVSAADLLAEPVLVARAVGTCVVPLECQRHRRDPG